MATSWDWLTCEALLGSLMGHLTQPINPWDEFSPHWGPDNPRRRCSIADIDNARATCVMWRGIIDLCTEWACIRLARWDYRQESGPHWEGREAFEVAAFAKNWAVFGKSWKMVHPIREDRLRMSAIGSLSCIELDALRTLLWCSGNQEIWLAPGQKLSPADDIWVCKDDRDWFEL